MQMLEKRPQKRITIDELKTHPYFADMSVLLPEFLLCLFLYILIRLLAATGL